MSDASDHGRKHHAVRAGRDAISAVQLPQNLTAAIDAWAEAHRVNRSDAIRQLVELGLRAEPAAASQHPVRQHGLEIEDEAIGKVSRLLDPSLPPEERERRIRRLIEGPPEFSEERIDLPKHTK
jgi:Arc/MetJ-type ribon-helix-helix transcriptional regulator